MDSLELKTILASFFLSTISFFRIEFPKEFTNFSLTFGSNNDLCPTLSISKCMALFPVNLIISFANVVFPLPDLPQIPIIIIYLLSTCIILLLLI